MRQTVILLYIPHGSDERYRWESCSHRYRALYIPHGSDERRSDACSTAFLICFISHMVQMKAAYEVTSENGKTTLYPTWFRWKQGFEINPSLKELLYIPHGSDESLGLKKNSVFPLVFISHMVQMKACAERSRLYGQRSLYPTWFRWKYEISSNALYTNDFISHMVQMKDMKFPQMRSIPTTLYPTWFRWKMPLHGSLCQPYKLYIPHGSDESDFVEVCIASNSNFISHMVQMKVPIVEGAAHVLLLVTSFLFKSF